MRVLLIIGIFLACASLSVGQKCSEGCESCSPTTGKCLECNTFFYGLNESGSCSKCATKNCLDCKSNYKICSECKPKYGSPPSSKGTICSPCGGAKCATCNTETPQKTCSGCEYSYDPDANGICKKCTKGCIDCKGGPCTECERGYNLKNGKCVACSSYCADCSKSYPQCDECAYAEDDYADDIGSNGQGQCFKCPNNCLNCDNSNPSKVCSECHRGYGLDKKGVCFKCADSNCIECSNKDTCKYCYTGYVVKNGKCSKCPSDCERCDINGKCTECNFNQGLSSDGRCKSCASKACEACDGNDPKRCYKCSSGYNLNRAKECVKCPEKCNTCNGDTKKCIECEQGYPISYGATPSGTCAPCGVDYCDSCDGDQKICKACKERYALNAAKTACVKCEEEKCVACKSTNLAFCTECDLYYGVTSAGGCIKCVDKNCLSCSGNSPAVCKECPTGYGVDASKGCSKCSVANCSNCDGNTGACKRCYENYTYNAAKKTCTSKIL